MLKLDTHPKKEGSRKENFIKFFMTMRFIQFSSLAIISTYFDRTIRSAPMKNREMLSEIFTEDVNFCEP